MRPAHRQYVHDSWQEVLFRSGMSEREAIERTRVLYRAALAMGIRRREIRRNRLDNPFAQPHALATLLADIRKNKEARHRGVHRTRLTLRAYGARQCAARAAELAKLIEELEAA